jgi:hypothetical protein
LPNTFISYFKRFDLFLGISSISIGLILNSFSENASGVFIAIYPILAYIYFIAKSRQYYLGKASKWNSVGLIVISATLVFVITLLALGFEEDHLIVHTDGISIEGSYGEDISYTEIESIQLVDQLPAIIYKSNGFALGSIQKGYFKTKSGEEVKLIVNDEQNLYIVIVMKDGQKIYYGAKKKSNEDLFAEMRNALPEVNFL